MNDITENYPLQFIEGNPTKMIRPKKVKSYQIALSFISEIHLIEPTTKVHQNKIACNFR